MRGLPLPLITAVFSFHVFRSVRMQTALTAQLLWRINLSAFPASILAFLGNICIWVLARSCYLCLGSHMVDLTVVWIRSVLSVPPGAGLLQYSATGPFSQLIYKNISVPVYTALKGVSDVLRWRCLSRVVCWDFSRVGVLFQKATQISSVPLADDESGSEDDSSSLASLRTSTVSPDKKGSVPGSPRAVKRGKIWGKSDVCRVGTPVVSPQSQAVPELRSMFFPGVSMSSISSESDYAIPPDACSLDSDYSEPEHKVQRTSSYSCESTGPVSVANITAAVRCKHTLQLCLTQFCTAGVCRRCWRSPGTC